MACERSTANGRQGNTRITFQLARRHRCVLIGIKAVIQKTGKPSWILRTLRARAICRLCGSQFRVPLLHISDLPECPTEFLEFQGVGGHVVAGVVVQEFCAAKGYRQLAGLVVFERGPLNLVTVLAWWATTVYLLAKSEARTSVNLLAQLLPAINSVFSGPELPSPIASSSTASAAICKLAYFKYVVMLFVMVNLPV